MTDLLKPVRRRTSTATHAHRNLVVELRPGIPDSIYIREEKRRSGYEVSIETIWQLAARLYAEELRKQRIAKRKARRSRI